MNIYPVLPVNVQPAFGNSKRTNTDRAATVADIYEAEDRIKAHQEKLIKEQNKKLTDTLKLQLQTFYYTHNDNSDIYDSSLSNINKSEI